MGRHVKPYPLELRGVRCGWSLRCGRRIPSQWAAIVAVKDKLGIGTAETLRHWVRQAEVDAGSRPGWPRGRLRRWRS